MCLFFRVAQTLIEKRGSFSLSNGSLLIINFLPLLGEMKFRAAPLSWYDTTSNWRYLQVHIVLFNRRDHHNINHWPECQEIFRWEDLIFLADVRGHGQGVLHGDVEDGVVGGHKDAEAQRAPGKGDNFEKPKKSSWYWANFAIEMRSIIRYF